MNKLALVFIFFLVVMSAAAKPRKLTQTQIEDANAFVEHELQDDPNWVKHLHKSKDHPRTANELKDLEKFQRKVEKMEIQVVTMAKLKKLTRLDRNWDEVWLIEASRGRMSTLHRHYFAGINPNE